MDEIFRADLAQATEIAQDKWAQRTPWARSSETIARRFEQLL